MVTDPKAQPQPGGSEVEAGKPASTRLATCGHGASQLRPGEAEGEVAAGRTMAAGAPSIPVENAADAADGDEDESHAGHGWRGRGRS